MASHRKATGAYYTPPALIDLLLEHALDPNSPIQVLDPSCGAGDFLLAAHQRHPGARLFGIDIDGGALERCREALAGCDFVSHHSDALLDPPAFLKPHSFDLIVGNPPYVNGIEGSLSAEMKAGLRTRYPRVRGAADLAHYFLEQAIGLVKPGGRIAFVLPRAILNSPAAAALRSELPPYLRPNLIYAPERHDFFPGAAVFICLLILGPEALCKVSTDPDPAGARFRSMEIAGDNWWLALHGEGDAPAAETLSSRFQLAASMIAADAYDLVPHLVDDSDGAGPRLATTGLIEPRQCLWGERTCRYLKKDYRHPRLADSPALGRSLAARVEKARRPKILLAGLARKIEAFLDPAGEYIGAVSTFSIYHPDDDIDALRKLLDHLLSPAATAHLIRHLGANALRGRHITLKKSYLLDLPLA